MMEPTILKCSACGWEQQSRLRPEDKRELSEALAVYCGRRVCPATDGWRSINGSIRVWHWFGSWCLERLPSLEEYRSVKRAKVIRDTALSREGQSWTKQSRFD